MRSFDFLNILTLLAIFTGLIVFVDWLLFRRGRPKEKVSTKTEGTLPVLVDYARSFFPVFVIVLVIRAFIAQPYRVPSSSLAPTILPGDFILVNQFDYGFKLPLLDRIIFKMGHPEEGQIALFRWPVNPDVTFVKRVIGEPGDHISYVHKVLYINGKEAKQTLVGDTMEVLENGSLRRVTKYQENLNGVKHDIYVSANQPDKDFKDLVVPPGAYLMMGDNRDNSDDGRDWGFVPENAFIGRAFMIWLSWDSQKHSIRWDRIGTRFASK